MVVFAFNNADTNYVEITRRTTALMRKNLTLPITVITGHDEVIDFDVDKIIRIDQGTFKNSRASSDLGRQVEWKNFGRYMAYELSPYDETLLLDTDYLVLCSDLLKYFDTEFDYLIMDRNRVLGQDELSGSMGTYSSMQLWATVVFFRKTQKSKMLFDLVGGIQQNYAYYKLLYNIATSNFRNDYAFAIADSVLNGYVNDPATKLPMPLFTISGPLKSIDHGTDFLLVSDVSGNRLVVPYTDLHVMSKRYLLSDNFREFVDGT